MTKRYDYSAMTAQTIATETEAALAEADRLVGTAVAAHPPTFDTTIRPLSEAASTVLTGGGRGAYVGMIHPDGAVREAARRAEEALESWAARFAQRDDVAAAIRRFAATDEASTLSGVRRRALDLWLHELQRAGHELSPDERAQFAALRERMVALSVAFQRNLGEWREEMKLAHADLAGLDPEFITRLPDGPEPGSRILPIAQATVPPFLEQSTRPDLREQVLRRYLSRAESVNRPVLEELLELRRQAARLLGRASWSDYANEARMSGSAAGVSAFLARLIGPLQELAAVERAEMRHMLREAGYDREVEAWDWRFLGEQQRRAIGLSAGELSEHFPLEAVLRGLFGLVHDVFGVDVTEEKDEQVWDSHVRFFVLRDAATGEHLSDLYVDLFARDGKPPGAWVRPLRHAVNTPGEPRRPASLLLATNVSRPPEGPPLLQHSDVETLFHEFGHVLEFGLQRSELPPALYAWVELDYIEAPSQLMENWAWEPEVLSRFAIHHRTGDAIPGRMLAALAATRRLNSGIETLWEFIYRAVLDQLLHGAEAIDTEHAYRRAFEVTGFPFPEGTYQPASFHHSAEWYDAGFYSYAWARVFGDDMFSVFAREGVMSAQVGRRYRKEVLEPFWSVPGRERTRNFLGREPSEQAFLERIGIAR